MIEATMRECAEMATKVVASEATAARVVGHAVQQVATVGWREQLSEVEWAMEVGWEALAAMVAREGVGVRRL